MSGQAIYVTGAGGLIGHELVAGAPKWAPGRTVRGLGRADLDIADGLRVREFFRREPGATVIHCAAISKSPACDANRGLAERTNVEGTRFLAEAADGRFVFFSTDLVFDGKAGNYREEDPPNPLMFYGETKARAEEIARAHPNHVIVRISLTGGRSPTGDRGFNEEMKNAWRAGRTLNLFTDEYRAPLAAEIVARAVWELALGTVRGTFHLASPEKLSRFEIGRRLAEKHPELSPLIAAGTRADYQGPPRPADTSLAVGKAQRELSFALPRFAEWIAADRSGF